MKKVLWASLTALLVIVLLLAGVFYTPIGTKFLDIALHKFAIEYVHYKELKGVIGKNLEITGVKVFTPGLDIGAESIHLEWSISALLKKELVVNALKIEELGFFFKANDEPDTDEKTDKPFVLSLPRTLSPLVDVSLGSLTIHGIGFTTPSGEMVEHLDMATLSATIFDTNLTITKLQVEDTAYGVNLSGSAVTGETWWADVGGTWRFSNWEGGELLGSLAAVGPLPDMDVKVELLAPTYVDIVGKMTGLPGNPYFDVVGKGDYTALPVVHHNIPDIRLDALVHATGFVNDYKAELETTGEYWKFKGITAKGTLWGNFDEIHFPSMQFKHQETVVDLIGAYLDWDESFVVGGKVVPHNFNPGIMDERFPGDLSGVIDGKLTVEYGDDGEIFGWYSLRNVEGILRDYPIKGGVNLRFTDSSLWFDKIELLSGESQLLYKGNFEDDIDMSLKVKSSNIQEFYPDGKGSLDILATLKGSYEKPKLTAQVRVEDLQLLDVQIASIRGKAGNAKEETGDYHMELTAKDVSLYGEEARNGRLLVDGNFENYQGQLQLSRDRAGFDMQFSGAFIDGVWSTVMKEGALHHEVFGDWVQEGETAFVVDNEHFHLSNVIMKNGVAQLSTDGEYSFDEKGTFDFSGRVENYSLSQVQAMFSSANSPYTILGTLDSSFKIQGNKEQLQLADLQLETEDVTVSVPIRDSVGEEKVVSKKAVLSGTFDGDRVKISLQGDANASKIVSDLNLLWQGRWDAEPSLVALTGKTSFSQVSLGLLASQSNYLVESRGHVFGDFTLSGSLAKPIVQGDMELVDGSIFLPEQGIDLNNIKVSVKGDGDRLFVDGHVFSGGGSIRAQGALEYDADRGITGKIKGKGDDFLVLDVPEYTIYASPDVLFSFDKNGMQIKGNVKIPKGKISSVEKDIEQVTESDDVVIIDVKTGQQEKGYVLNSSLKLDLGENVEFSRYGITGRLAGQLEIEDDTSTPLRGDGEVSIVNGVFSAYGKSFEIARGKVLFTGGPLVNPGLDVRVQKKIRMQTGTMQGRYTTVGLDISGYANNISYTLFSSPYMEDADILSYLLLGHSLFSAKDEESNVLAEAASSFGWKRSASLISKIAAVLPVDDVHLESGGGDHDMSLIVGKNVTKDLYVGYDYNVLDQLGEILLRYNLKNGFFIESTTSQESTGADLLYIFEK